jgi:molybdenum cofactor cytidylyltransferase
MPSITAAHAIDVGIVLAAGGSSRMGRPKALLLLDGRPLIAHHVEALGRVVRRVVVVLGADPDPIRAILAPSVATVHNAAWASTWPADSLRLALLAHPTARTALVTPVDTPPAAASTLDALTSARATAVVSGPGGHDGHPVLLGPAELDAVRGQAPPGGLRSLLRGAERISIADPLACTDFDDPMAWQEFTAAWTTTRAPIRHAGTAG